MTRERLDEILSGFARARIAVVGDFFLDDYLEVEPALAEVSLETGLEARQVVAVRRQPGGAGNVAANLCALGVERVECVGVIGDDGEGFELGRALRSVGARTEHLIARPELFTPTYRKPIVRLAEGEVRELERLDTKNRRPMRDEVEQELIARLCSLAPQLAGIVVQDQVQEAECGVVTTRVREALAELVADRPSLKSLVDSRTRVGLFRGLALKCNEQEACGAIGGAEAVQCAAGLSRRAGAPVFLTMGAQGIAVVTGDEVQRVPTAQVEGPLDIVGAGDSAGAGILAALSAGASLGEAAIIGNIVASVTVQQIGTTGSATQQQARARLREFEGVWRELPPVERMEPSAQA
ncbi:MAG: bifunctional heptose 7-phosphate kinase/heptose 1-phosphate adenyltransferase [Armatimonadota bacterium]